MQEFAETSHLKSKASLFLSRYFLCLSSIPHSLNKQICLMFTILYYACFPRLVVVQEQASLVFSDTDRSPGFELFGLSDISTLPFASN